MEDISAIKSEISLVFSIVKPILSEIRKDGFQVSDIFAFIGSEEFKEHLGETIKEFPDTFAEVADFSAFEGIELAGHILSESKGIIEIYKK